jgi:hypothetical protein
MENKRGRKGCRKSKESWKRGYEYNTAKKADETKSVGWGSVVRSSTAKRKVGKKSGPGGGT